MASSVIHDRGFYYIQQEFEVTSTSANQVVSLSYPNGRRPKGLVITKGCKVGSSTTTLTDIFIQQITHSDNVSFVRYTAPSTGTYTLYCIYTY